MKVYTVAGLTTLLEGFRGDLPLQTLRDHVGYEDGATVEVYMTDGRVTLNFS